MMKQHLHHILGKLREAIKYSNNIWINDSNKAVQDLVLLMVNDKDEQIKKKKEEEKKTMIDSKDTVLCKDCIRMCVDSGGKNRYCPILSSTLKVRFKMQNKAYSLTHPQISPPPGFTCPYGKAKESKDSELEDKELESNKEVSRKPESMQNSSTLAKLFTQATHLPKPSISSPDVVAEDIKDILTVLLSYLMAHEHDFYKLVQCLKDRDKLE